MSKILKKGIDISVWQNVNYSQIDKSQVEFAIIRSSFGWQGNQVDKMFETHYKGLTGRGIPVGAYHYSYATNTEEAVLEADYMLKAIKGKKFELPLYLDLEEDKIGRSLGKTKMTDVAIAFCHRIEKAGYRAGVYCNLNWASNYVDIDRIKKAGFTFWLAQYNSVAQCACDIWQYSDSGNVKGISGTTDMNYMYTDVIKSNKTNSNSKTTTTANTANNTTSKTTATNELQGGTKVVLKNVPLYVSCSSNSKVATKSGTYYIWSKDIFQNKIRITDSLAHVGKNNQVTGWISVDDAKKSSPTAPKTNSTSFTPYTVKVTADVLNIRKGAGTNFGTNGTLKYGSLYTIIAESTGQGATKWGKLKTGAGWISLDYAKKI